MHDREQELNMMRDALDWPLAVALPLKRPSSDGHGWPELGFLAYGCGPVVYDGDFLSFVDSGVDDPARARERLKVKLRYESYEELYDDGWRVD